MPNPPTPEELEGWERLSSKLFAGEYAMAELEELCLGVDALLAEVKRLREERDAWKALCEAKNGLLMAYRTGNSSRIDAVLTRIEKAKDRLTALDAAATPQASPKPLPDDLRTPRTTPRL